ncbi:hypothetical protein NC652_016670 [Populus alba x Populus x berolinensis]|nr:hypothetical protein NC652_016670 [Populus alba x Populus x berolinensis]
MHVKLSCHHDWQSQEQAIALIIVFFFVDIASKRARLKGMGLAISILEIYLSIPSNYVP